MSVLPANVILEVGLALFEGARKYGRHNYRAVGVRSSVYYDATMRHLMAWWEGQDVDPDSGISHITKAIASLVVLRDAMMQDKMEDDRPPETQYGPNNDFIRALNLQAEQLIERYPNAKPAITKQS